MFRIAPVYLFLVVSLGACETTDSIGPEPPPGNLPPPVEHSQPTPLTELVRDDGVADTYLGFEGGLYLGRNSIPAAHAAFGRESINRIQPLDLDGNPTPDGTVVLLSIGMSNVTQEWCQFFPGPSSRRPSPCNPWTFMGRMSDDPRVNPNVFILNGARGARALDDWDEPTDTEFDRVKNTVLRYHGVSEAQVQVIWIKAALGRELFPDERHTLPASDSDAYVTEFTAGNHLRALKSRYPNLRMVIISSRTNGSHSPQTSASPEPIAFETGFVAKWLIEAQIEQRATGRVDDLAGDLVSGDMPFLVWGPYLWAYGDRPREDGLQWTADLVENDGVHPTEEGERIVADYLEEFFTTSEFTTCWFIAGNVCE